MFNIKSLYKTKTNYWDKIFKSFNLTEKTILILLVIVLLFSGLSILNKLNSRLVSEVPANGGSLKEGLIGSPRFINPLLELSDADRDLTYLIYSGLMRASVDNNLTLDLAESYTISDDGLTYTFIIKDDAYFHDGIKVTADDIEYTISMAQNSTLRSPKRTNWNGVTVRKINDSEIAFDLKQPYSPFLENTTLGILPKHIWSSATADEFAFSPYNINAIGSGPYQIEKINRNSSGIPTSYEMKSFSRYTLGEPFITNLKIFFYPNEKELSDAYTAGEIESTSALSPQNSDTLKNANISEERISLPRIFGLFFNQNQNKIFLNKEVRTALNMTVDKNRIVSEVLGGYGEVIDNPIPSGVIGVISSNSTTTAKEYNRDESIKSAQEILTKAGWKFNDDEKIWEKVVSKTETLKLAFDISTSNTEDLKKTAEILKEDWTMLGAQVTVQSFDPTDLNQTVIGQRNYDSLLFGQVVGRSLDLFAFWHSSQRLTGYNIAMYTNTKADKLLENARQTRDFDARVKNYTLFETEIKNDIPAIFIYSPQFTYILPKKIQGFSAGLINNRSERFEQIYKWYVETDKVWKFLVK